MKYRNIRVFIAPRLINLLSSNRSRGMALMWFILIRQPDKFDYVESTTGKKYILRLLEHEYTHIKRQSLWWFVRYWTSSTFRHEEERIAIASETNFDLRAWEA